MTDDTLPEELPPADDLLAELRWRGLVSQTTDDSALAADLLSGSLTLYCGFDPTAPSLHVGNLVPLLTLRRFQDAGHKVLALVGGATGLIGDPSGRSAERSLNDTDTVNEWVTRISDQLAAVLVMTGDNPAVPVSNYDWTSQLSAIDLLRDIGKHFSVNQMLAKESVSTRLAGEGISYTEFSYMVLQANDYLELYRTHGCTLQIGGSDQWGNITAGLDLIRRVEGGQGPRAHALTVPLVTRADGAKFGKTAAGAVWLSADLTSPYAFYQFWINTDDRDVSRYLRMFSRKSPAEIVELEQLSQQRPAARIGQRALAEELTTLVHSAEDAANVDAASKALFGRGDITELDEATLAAALQEAPHATLPDTATVVEAFVATGLSESKAAARRAIAEGGGYVNNERLVSVDSSLSDFDTVHGWWLLRRGKRSIAGVQKQ
jgi:tyrosyl-tRNA synthetase